MTGMNDYDETQIAIQIAVDISALSFNLCLFVFLSFKIFIKKQYAFNRIIALSMLYIFCTIVACLYELLYRFIVHVDQCEISDIIQEIFICITRSILLIYYVVLIDQVFNKEKSEYNIKKYKIIALYIIIFVIHMIILPAIYISFHKTYPIQLKTFGVYCFNDLIPNVIAFVGVLLYQLTDVIITIFLCAIFIYKLCKISKDTKTTILKKTMCSSFILTLISVISSWVIIAAGRLDGDKDTFWRWMYPLDYIFNTLCVFLWLGLNNNNKQHNNEHKHDVTIAELHNYSNEEVTINTIDTSIGRSMPSYTSGFTPSCPMYPHLEGSEDALGDGEMEEFNYKSK